MHSALCHTAMLKPTGICLANQKPVINCAIPCTYHAMHWPRALSQASYSVQFIQAKPKQPNGLLAWTELSIECRTHAPSWAPIPLSWAWVDPLLSLLHLIPGLVEGEIGVGFEFGLRFESFLEFKSYLKSCFGFKSSLLYSLLKYLWLVNLYLFTLRSDHNSFLAITNRPEIKPSIVGQAAWLNSTSRAISFQTSPC